MSFDLPKGKKFVCGCCGKTVFAEDKDYWAYKLRKDQRSAFKYFCSWKCLRAYEEEHFDEKVRKKANNQKRYFRHVVTGEIITSARASEIAELSLTAIYKYFKRREKLLNVWEPVTKEKDGTYAEVN